MLRRPDRYFGTLLFIIAVSVIMSVCMAGCSSYEPEGGLSYLKVSSSMDLFMKPIDDDLEAFLDSAEGYVCIIEQNAPSDIVIPDEYDGLPVYVVTTRRYVKQDTSYIVKGTINSITFGKNVKYLNCVFMDGEGGNIRELVIPENVQEIRASFRQMRDATVYLEGAPYCNQAFEYPESVVIRTATADGMAAVYDDMEELVYSTPYYDQRYLVGTNEIFNREEGIDKDTLLERGQSHFCEELDQSKKIDPSSAASYVRFADGPVVTMDTCPSISSSLYLEQDRQSIIESSGPRYLDIAYTAARYAEDMYEYGDDSASGVYFIVEKTGGTGVSYFAGTGATIATEADYLMGFRVSIRDIDTDELICWFETTEGYAPERKVSGTRTFEEGGRHYMRDENSKVITSSYVVHKYFS